MELKFNERSKTLFIDLIIYSVQNFYFLILIWEEGKDI